MLFRSYRPLNPCRMSVAPVATKMRVAAPKPSTAYTAPSRTASSRRNSAASKPGSTSIPSPSPSTIRKCPRRSMIPRRVGLMPACPATISTGTICSWDADDATRRRQASSVGTLNPCAAQNSLRPRPLRSNSATNRAPSAPLRRRRTAPFNPCSAIPLLQHSTRTCERIALPEWVRYTCDMFILLGP